MLSIFTGPAADAAMVRRLGALVFGSFVCLAALPSTAEPLTLAAHVATSPSGGHIERSSFAEPRQSARRPTPEACAADFHARFAAIAGTELAALKAAEPVAGPLDATLPGRLLFAAAASRPAGYDRPIKLAADLAGLRGRVKVPDNANSRWIAGRIEMDLTDYLTQGPSPYLCSGVANYLETLRRYAAQVGASPMGRSADIEMQKAATTASIHAARLALRQPPRPTPAPINRPMGLISSRSLLIEAEMRLRTDGAGPVRLAGRGEDGETLADVSGEPTQVLGGPLALGDAADRLRVVDRLLDESRRAGLLPPDTLADNAAARQAEERAMADGRPVLLRLARLRGMLDGRAMTAGSSPALAALETAFADIEALDYLLADADGRSDPIGTALARTMNAIETAHAQACACGA